MTRLDERDGRSDAVIVAGRQHFGAVETDAVDVDVEIASHREMDREGGSHVQAQLLKSAEVAEPPAVSQTQPRRGAKVVSVELVIAVHPYGGKDPAET
ncbi:hypothetical protein [Aeromicrobium phragmitis]|uniref:hypothetical protein n=1 Tax=Aeromicrobium phragmitis TaxID=2478914 RepID=UPI00105BEFEC|nr:hypothetical protein [Aeromicrobium phragmitis]